MESNSEVDRDGEEREANMAEATVETGSIRYFCHQCNREISPQLPVSKNGKSDNFSIVLMQFEVGGLCSKILDLCVHSSTVEAFSVLFLDSGNRFLYSKCSSWRYRRSCFECRFRGVKEIHRTLHCREWFHDILQIQNSTSSYIATRHLLISFIFSNVS